MGSDTICEPHLNSLISSAKHLNKNYLMQVFQERLPAYHCIQQQAVLCCPAGFQNLLERVHFFLSIRIIRKQIHSEGKDNYIIVTSSLKGGSGGR